MQDIWNAVREGLGYVLAFFYSIIPNTGVAIILLTVSVRLILFPLTAKQAKSMIAMQRVQPEIKKLQAKYKNDRQKLNEEMMAFYKENNINPLGGCLPLLLQMPVFIALFQTLRDIQNFIPQKSSMYAAICGSSSVDPSKCKPNMHFAGMNLTKSASSVASSQGFADVVPYLILVAIVVVTGFIQQRQTMRNQSQPNPQMAVIGKIFPIVFAFISWTAASGVALYFATTNIWQIGQQELVYRKIVTKDAPPPKSGGGSGGAGPKPDKEPDKDRSGTTTATKSKPSGGGKGTGGNGAGRPAAGKNGSAKGGSPKGASPKGGSGGGSQGGSTPNRAGQARSNRKRKR